MFFFSSCVLLSIFFLEGVSRSEQNTRQKAYRLTLLIGTYSTVKNHYMLQQGDATGVTSYVNVLSLLQGP